MIRMQNKVMGFFRVWCVVAASLMLAACGGEGSGAGLTAVSSLNTLVITPSTITVATGSPATVTLTLKDASGHPVSGKVFFGAPSSVTVSPNTVIISSSGTATATISAKTTGMGVISTTFSDNTGTGEGPGINFTSTGSSDPGAGGTTAGSIQLLVSKPVLSSSDADFASGITVTAQVKTLGNAAIPGAQVTFAVDGDALISAASVVSDATGAASVKLAVGANKSNRVLHVTATSGGATAAIDVPVTGTKLSVSGPDSLVLGGQGDFTVTLLDASGTGISGKNVTVNSAKSNTISAASMVTNATGQMTFSLTSVASGQDTLTIEATGTGTTPVTKTLLVSADKFEFSTPSSNLNVPLNTSQTVKVLWVKNGVAVSGKPVQFSTTRGVFSNSSPAMSATTNSSGIATVAIQSSQSGEATLTAVGDGGVTAALPLYFKATTPASITVQASPSIIGTQSQSALTATVRDAQGNLVKDATVQFSLEDTTGGTLSTASVTTDELGRAGVTYTSSDTTSSKDGVTVTATVANTTISASTLLTVGGQAMNITLGAGNKIDATSDVFYQLPLGIIVTDAVGHPVSNADVDLSVVSTGYYKGVWVYSGTDWAAQTSAGDCGNEDPENTADINSPFVHDDNNSGTIEPGNKATVSPVTLDANGSGTFNLTYPKNYGAWLNVEVTAVVKVGGSESSQKLAITLPVAAADLKSPGGPSSTGVSPYGTSAVCTDTN